MVYGSGGCGGPYSDPPFCRTFAPPRSCGPSSDVVDGALAGDLDLAAVSLLGLGLRPLVAELVGDVGDDDLAGLRARRVLAGLLRGQVAPRSLPLGARQRALDEQQVGAVGEADELLGRR